MINIIFTTRYPHLGGRYPQSVWRPIPPWTRPTRPINGRIEVRSSLPPMARLTTQLIPVSVGTARAIFGWHLVRIGTESI